MRGWFYGWFAIKSAALPRGEKIPGSVAIYRWVPTAGRGVLRNACLRFGFSFMTQHFCEAKEGAGNKKKFLCLSLLLSLSPWQASRRGKPGCRVA